MSLQSSTLDSLPKSFVQAMRTLFDLMDDKKTGFVNFSDIQDRWREDRTQGLPKGVLESLQKVTPSNGKLTFERFCAGLKICLLRNQVEVRTQKPQPIRPPSAPILDLDHNPWPTTATVRPNVIANQRTLSMPHLKEEGLKPTYAPPKPPRTNIENKSDIRTNLQNWQSSIDPPMGKSELRPTLQNWQTNLDPPMSKSEIRPALQTWQPSIDAPLNKSEIRSALQNWQVGILNNEKREKKREESAKTYRTLGDGKPPKEDPFPRSLGDGKSSDLPIYQKKTSKRREPRRHTLQNGIDFNMLKKIKKIEQEKEVLLVGLQAVDKAKEWYLKQLGVVQEKIKYLGRMGTHMEHWTEAQQERLELQRARVLEVNRHLATLTDSWERGGLPLHMNLAVSNYNPDMLNRLKQQNHLLTEEVSQKSERISVLEREKASLIRELLQSRSGTRSGQDEAVF